MFKLSNQSFDENTDVLYKLVHTTTFNKSVQALQVLFQIMKASDTQSCRFYSALYERLFAVDVFTSSKHTLFLNLLFKALKYDNSSERIYAFFKRILQLCITFAPPPFICACLILISQIVSQNPSAAFLLSKKRMNEMITSSILKKDDDEEDEEVYYDVLDDDLQTSKLKKRKENLKVKPKEKEKKNVISKKETINEKETKTRSYDPRKRDPQYANALSEELWELRLLCSHTHPSVCAIAKSLIENAESISYEGNPIRDFSIMAFLDRFVYKNPKTRDLNQKGKANELPKQSGRLNVFSQQHIRSSLFRPAVNDGIAKLAKEGANAEVVPVDERFFHEFFVLRNEHDQRAGFNEKENPKKDINEEALVSSEEEESESESESESENEEKAEYSYSDLDDEEDFTAKVGGEDDLALMKKKKKKLKKAKVLSEVSDGYFVNEEEDNDDNVEEDGLLEDSGQRLGTDEVQQLFVGSKKNKREREWEKGRNLKKKKKPVKKLVAKKRKLK